jgi:hypothetical protein
MPEVSAPAPPRVNSYFPKYFDMDALAENSGRKCYTWPRALPGHSQSGLLTRRSARGSLYESKTNETFRNLSDRGV